MLADKCKVMIGRYVSWRILICEKGRPHFNLPDTDPDTDPDSEKWNSCW